MTKVEHRALYELGRRAEQKLSFPRKKHMHMFQEDYREKIQM
jgi:hypothetical protein